MVHKLILGAPVVFCSCPDVEDLSAATGVKVVTVDAFVLASLFVLDNETLVLAPVLFVIATAFLLVGGFVFVAPTVYSAVKHKPKQQQRRTRAFMAGTYIRTTLMLQALGAARIAIATLKFPEETCRERSENASKRG